MEFQDKIEERIKQYVISRTKVTDAEYDTHLSKNGICSLTKPRSTYGRLYYRVDCDMDAVIYCLVKLTTY